MAGVIDLTQDEWDGILNKANPKDLLPCCDMIAKLRYIVRRIAGQGLGVQLAEDYLMQYHLVAAHHDISYSRALTHIYDEALNLVITRMGV